MFTQPYGKVNRDNSLLKLGYGLKIHYAKAKCPSIITFGERVKSSIIRFTTVKHTKIKGFRLPLRALHKSW